MCDILLTTDEEMGRSTATEFAEDFEGKDYNWIIQFDRGGTDVVMYQYETKEYCSLVEGSGARVGMGSYSDICELDGLGCAGFNWGVGYEDYHSPRAHAWLNDTFRMVARFLRFHATNATTHLHHNLYAEPADDTWPEWYKDGEEPDAFEADCGHMVDTSDPEAWIEWADDYIICFRCATAA